MIKSLHIKNFTTFDDLEVELSPKINVIIGENSTGKTHILKILYVMSSIYKDKDEELQRKLYTDKFLQVFKPFNDSLGKLRKSGAPDNADLKICHSDDSFLELDFAPVSKLMGISNIKDNINQNSHDNANPVFIPAREIISIMKGLSSILQKYKTSFDETYSDLINMLEMPERKPDLHSEKTKYVMNKLTEILGGRFIFQGGGIVIFKQTKYEYSANLMAEGFRKLGILYRLMETGSLNPESGVPLLWDEPDVNLNPLLIKLLVESLYSLAREGQQIIVATHSYYLVKWMSLLYERNKGDEIIYHSLYRNESNEIRIDSSDNLNELKNNPILKSFEDMYDYDIEKAKQQV
jgi:AAA15 family ATPase/GTPase